MQTYKSEMHVEFQKKHICEVIIRKCVHCGRINKQRKIKGEQIEKSDVSKKTKEYRSIMKSWRTVPICDRCGDSENPHKRVDCKKQR